MAVTPHERVVVWHRSVIVEPENLAPQTHQVLRNLVDVATRGHVDLAVRPEHDAAIETRVTWVGIGDQQIANSRQRSVLEPAPRKRRGAHAVSDRLGVGQVDETVVGEAGMQRDIHEPAIAVGPHRGQAGYGSRIQMAVAHDAESTGPLGHQHLAFGWKRDSPGVGEPISYDGDADPVLLCRIEHPGPLTERRHGDADLRLGQGMATGQEADGQRGSKMDGVYAGHAGLRAMGASRSFYRSASTLAGHTIRRQSA